MHWYQLDRDASELFLKGEAVECKLAMKSIWDLKSGDAIIVRLVNGKKFKGVVKKISLFAFKQAFVGEMTVKRTL
jgi:hypothetical protein